MESREMNIDFNFATKDDCLDKMVPSDLRQLVRERDKLREMLGLAWEAIQEAGYEDHCFELRKFIYE
jgi:hypothetical protein